MLSIIIISTMKVLLLLALLSTLSSQQTLLLASNPSNTVIVSPASLSVGVEPYHNANHANHIGNGAQWVWQSGGSSWKDGLTLQFQTQFYASCFGPATLTVTADNAFTAVLNGGGSPMTGNDWTKKYSFALSPLKCGKNVLRIKAVNRDNSSPAGLIFSVVQDQSKCFGCDSPLSFFNRNTCQCECIQGWSCIPTNSLYIWNDYPVCGYSCGIKAKCPEDRYFDQNECSCFCVPKACPAGLEQDSQTCECRKPKVKPKCDLSLIRFSCKPNERFDIGACQCVLKCPVFIREPDCPANRQWSQEQCACICKIQICLPPARYDEKTCTCVPNYYNNI